MGISIWANKTRQCFTQTPVPRGNHALQKTYDRAVIQELVVWFRERFDRLPQSIQLRPGMVIPDVKVMVRNYFDVVQMHYENPTTSS